jgi:hypothetical protein
MKKFFLFCFLLIFFIVGCATFKKSEYYPEDNKYDKKICILYHYTKFRDGIIKQLLDKLKNNNIVVITDDAYNIKNYNPKDYDLIVVFSGIHAFIPDAYPRTYLEKYKDKKNIIHVFYTFLTKKGITIDTGEGKIDTITAASVKSNSEDLTESIYQLIMKKLKPNSTE